jgi:hypothetical protein
MYFVRHLSFLVAAIGVGLYFGFYGSFSKHIDAVQPLIYLV